MLSGLPWWLKVNNPPANAGDTEYADWILGLEDPLKEEMATHSSILAMNEHVEGDWRGYTTADN